MRVIRLAVAALAFGLLMVENAQAVRLCNLYACQLPTAGPGVNESVRETKFFAGLQWNFGDSQPELVLGARRSETSTSKEVRGGKIDLAIPLRLSLDEIKPVIRVLGVAGNRDVQGEFGFGLRLLDWKPLIAVGAQVPYANGGVNFVFNDGVKPYVGFNTLKRAVAPRVIDGAPTCPRGYILTPNGSIPGYGSADPSVLLNGKTCYSDS